MDYFIPGVSKGSILIIGISVILTSLYAKRRRHQRAYFDELPDGPSPSSWAAGALTDLIGTENIGELDAAYAKKYGLAFKVKGIFGSNMLFLADPRAMHYILNTRAYTFHKEDAAKTFRLFLGRGVLSSEGQDHARQRRILIPGFSSSILNSLVPVFAETTNKLISRWNDICQDNSSFHVIDVHSWLSRTTLDAIGKGVFSYDFGALDETPSEFVEAYRNLFAGILRKRSNLERAISDLLPMLPFWVMRLFQKFAFRITDRLAHFQDTARSITKDILEREIKAAEGQVPQGKDIMSILVRANMTEEPKRKMSSEELLSQTMVLTIAGHDTTSSALSWALYELGRHPDVQTKLRSEIMAWKAKLGGRGLTASDFDSLPYTSAVIKETLRCYPIVTHTLRRAGQDESIPLSRPIQLGNGRTSNSISIRRGQAVIMSAWVYNRLKELWGENSEEWNPERFLDDKLERQHVLGVYANLATFSSGVHSCIGWRFAILEMHIILVELIHKFEFRPPPEGTKLLRIAIPTLQPFVKGQEDMGSQLPMTVRLL